MADQQQQQNKQPKEAAIEALGKKAGNFHKLFTSPVGVKVLKALEEEFNPDVLMNPDPHMTSYNVGRRDVIVYIRQMIRYKENARRTELEG